MISGSAFPLLHTPLMPTGTRLAQKTALAGGRRLARRWRPPGWPNQLRGCLSSGWVTFRLCQIRVRARRFFDGFKADPGLDNRAHLGG